MKYGLKRAGWHKEIRRKKCGERQKREMSWVSLQPIPDADMQDNLLQMLECPVCMELMEPPIIQCRNGHTVCSTCKILLSNCPLCQEGFTNIPCRVLDSLADKLLYPCKNVQLGCKDKLKLSEKASHESRCVFNLYYCLPGRDSGCSWKGFKAELLDHVTQRHSLHLYKPGGDVLHTSINTNTVLLVNMFNELFWYHKRQDSGREKYFRALQYLGPKEKAEYFTCTYEFPLKCGDIKYKRVAYGEDEDMDAIYESENSFSSLVNYVRHQQERRDNHPNLLFCYTKIKKVV